jgi:hypothetical protein
MPLRIRFSDGTLKELTKEETDTINAKLDTILSPDFGKGFMKTMGDNFHEFMALGEKLCSRKFTGAERESIEQRFYELADTMRDDCNKHLDDKRKSLAQDHEPPISEEA